ncbi:MAG: 3-phosphoshikimate 1-carboxyvinyltransferase [Mycoplasmataceae bacterium]|nr:3-phosphoshikimate 1-carboxyvinyltransferase [Mycoplasmataceae bacterium]
MEECKVLDKLPKGEIVVPPSKSISHRMVICQMLANGKLEDIANLGTSNDITATINGMNTICNSKNNNDIITIDCNESGSTLRFLIPIAIAISNKTFIFTGSEKLFERPLSVYEEIFSENNIDFKKEKGKFIVSGSLKPNKFYVKGDVSSQFISGLLFALPLLDGDSEIIITTKLESKEYIDLTIDAMKQFNVFVVKQTNGWKIKGKQKYKPTKVYVEGDYSQAAFWLVAKALGNDVSCVGLNSNSIQGDKEIINVINQATNKLNPIVVDATNIPDLVPIITVFMCFLNGTSKIINASRVRLKESDRLHAITTELKKLGAEIEELPDSLIVHGNKKLHGGNVDAWNDHRIAMSLAIISTKIFDEIKLSGYDSVKKSYPTFWNDFEKVKK